MQWLRSWKVLLPLAAVLVLGAGVWRSRAADNGFPLMLTLTGGPDFVPIDYKLTIDGYRKWLAAQENLKREATDADLGSPAERILLTNPTAASIDAVVEHLEGSPRTRASIEAAGLPVRDYVLSTLAIYQATERPDTLDISPRGAKFPEGNITLVENRAPEVRAMRASEPVRFIDDRPRANSGKAKGKKGKGKGRGKGRGRS
jgi:hypothetical protein